MKLLATFMRHLCHKRTTLISFTIISFTIIYYYLSLTGCRRTSSSTPLATDCNLCLYVKNAQTGECLKECPEDWEQKSNECYPKTGKLRSVSYCSVLMYTHFHDTRRTIATQREEGLLNSSCLNYICHNR